jgi:hypothetical protein
MLRFFEQPTVRAVAQAIEELLLEQVEGLSEEEASQLLGEDTPL